MCGDDLICQVNPFRGAVLLGHVEIAHDWLDTQLHLGQQPHALLRLADLLDKGIGHNGLGVPALGDLMNASQTLAQRAQCGDFERSTVQVNDHAAIVQSTALPHGARPAL